MTDPVDEFQSQRYQMVRQQIRARGVMDKAVLKAMFMTPRHRFVDDSQAQFAYADNPLPIGFGQTISQPYIVAYMVEAAQISPTDKVLEIGTGCGYEAAVLSQLANVVYTVEIIPKLAEGARQRLSQLGYANVHVKIGNGYQGWVEHAPYNAILVTAAPPKIPQALIEQLAIKGRLIIPVGTWLQDLMVITKTENGLLKQITIPVRFVPMTGKRFPKVAAEEDRDR
ncbi:MAG: protein-L-isoaspartate(D-aspartate) O-methyltransferase [Leptolyngbyaceae cyanobacterium MO_188.B28]|nr:protein-L-isoaspartate(D-aspartate) O-methyltransferase [Leptolyngbyaceae cyanobacterium MO_188.B28]